MHHLQTKILYNLALHDGLRFSQLKPRDMESNQFMYHLKNVIAQGLVEKDNTVYRLSSKGLRYVNALSFELLSTRLQPVMKTMIYAENTNGEQLLYRFNRQPIRGRIGFVNGKIHFGETMVEAAKRELIEKSGLQASLNFAGQINSRTYSKEELVVHTFYFIFRSNKIVGQLKPKPDLHGISFWGKLEDYNESKIMPGLAAIVHQLQTSKTYFFEDIITQI